MSQREEHEHHAMNPFTDLEASQIALALTQGGQPVTAAQVQSQWPALSDDDKKKWLLLLALLILALGS